MPLIPHDFRASKKLYAIDESSLVADLTPGSVSGGKDYVRYSVQAVWFSKRSNGRLGAFTGTLWDGSIDVQNPWSIDDFIANIETARYGGNPEGCWDGKASWWAKPYADDEAMQNARLPFLKEMLENHPNIPQGYRGWFLLTE
jgi:hypothetical protein